MKGAIRPSSGPSGHLLPEGEGPGISKFRICLFIVLLVCLATQLPQPLTGSDRPAVAALDSIGITVSDIDRSVDFFSKILSFEKVSDSEIFGSEYEHLQKLFGIQARIVQMKLKNESIELTEYLTPKEQPIPIDSRSNDH